MLNKVVLLSALIVSLFPKNNLPIISNKQEKNPFSSILHTIINIDTKKLCFKVKT